MTRPYTPRTDGDTGLYRCYSPTGELLYIGCRLAINFNNRQRLLNFSKPWITEMRTMTVDWYPNRAEGFAAETAAIEAERPKYNIQHNIGTKTCEKHGVEMHVKGGGKYKRRYCPICQSEQAAARYRKKLGREADARYAGHGKWQQPKCEQVTAC